MGRVMPLMSELLLYLGVKTLYLDVDTLVIGLQHPSIQLMNC